MITYNTIYILGMCIVIPLIITIIIQKRIIATQKINIKQLTNEIGRLKEKLKWMLPWN
jgi:hypothetical protein